MSDETPAELKELTARLEALLPSIDAVDPTAAEEASAQLSARHPFDGEEVGAIHRKPGASRRKRPTRWNS